MGGSFRKAESQAVNHILLWLFSRFIRVQLSCNPIRLFCPRHFPGQNTRAGCHFLLQGIFPTQGLSPHLLHYRQILYHWATRGAPTHIYWSRIYIFFFWVLFIFFFNIFSKIYLFIWLYWLLGACKPLVVACGILVPWLGIEPGPPALGAQSLSHWTTRGVPENAF